MNEYTEMDFRFLCVFFTLPRALGSSPMLHSLHPQSGAQVLLGLLAGGARSHRKTAGGGGWAEAVTGKEAQKFCSQLIPPGV